MTKVYFEVGSKKVFACALDWPGWCRSAKTEDLALEELEAYIPRYTAVTKIAKIPFRHGSFDVVESIKGNATTDFGAPGVAAAVRRNRRDFGDAFLLSAPPRSVIVDRSLGAACPPDAAGLPRCCLRRGE